MLNQKVWSIGIECDGVSRVSLKLDGICTSVLRSGDKRLGMLQIIAVIGRHFCNDIG